MSNKNIKDIFNNASRSTSTFYTYGDSGMSDGDDVIIANPDSLPERIFKGVKEAAKTFSGKGEGYGNRLAAYNNYLNTLNYMKKAGQFRLGRGRVSTAPTRSGTGVAKGIKTTAFENQLDRWNARFRKFAVSSYYERLTRGK
tara:strand:+ start:1567 stop:1992 length:426 start_codon:yes stop_codon:yes gene_type:complete